MDDQLSIIEPEMANELSDSQLELLLGDDRPKIDRSKPEFQYDASRLWRDRPDVAQAAIKLLAEPRKVISFRRICKRLHMSYHTLRALEIANTTDIKAEKKNLGDLMSTVSEVYAQRAIETAHTVKGKDAVLGAAIAADKMIMFRGEATQRIDVGVRVDINAKIDQAQAKIMEAFENMKRAKAVEVVSPALPDSAVNIEHRTSNTEHRMGDVENAQRSTLNAQRPMEEVPA